MKMARVAKWIIYSLAALVFTVVATALVAPYGPLFSSLEPLLRYILVVSLPVAGLLGSLVRYLMRSRAPKDK